MFGVCSEMKTMLFFDNYLNIYDSLRMQLMWNFALSIDCNENEDKSSLNKN